MGALDPLGNRGWPSLFAGLADRTAGCRRLVPRRPALTDRCPVRHRLPAMVLLVLMGVVGAVLGASIKPRPLAVPAALALAAAVRALIGVLAPMAVGETPPPFFARIAFQIVQDGADDYAPLLSVAAAGAL